MLASSAATEVTTLSQAAPPSLTLMAGFILQPPDPSSFPVNADSIHYLVSRCYLSLPSTTRKGICGKSKADAFAKAAAMLQGTWIIVQSVARAVQHLSLSPLELFTPVFVVSTRMSDYFWWRKPQHAEASVVLYCEHSMAKILDNTGVAPDDYVDRPMGFVEKSLQFWGRRPLFEQCDLEGRAMDTMVSVWAAYPLQGFRMTLL
ncbi:hypothetical protein DL769_004552 [Monosporascus sp. CRB-8-3]|nr:hypothetical protein DL769_004552 [Monosporascus sp. CRB-8-3]